MVHTKVTAKSQEKQYKSRSGLAVLVSSLILSNGSLQQIFATINLLTTS